MVSCHEQPPSSSKATGIAVAVISSTAFTDPGVERHERRHPGRSATTPTAVVSGKAVIGTNRLAYIGQELYVSGQALGQRIRRRSRAAVTPSASSPPPARPTSSRATTAPRRSVPRARASSAPGGVRGALSQESTADQRLRAGAQVHPEGHIRRGRGLDRAPRPALARYGLAGKIASGGFDLTPQTLQGIKAGSSTSPSTSAVPAGLPAGAGPVPVQPVRWPGRTRRRPTPASPSSPRTNVGPYLSTTTRYEGSTHAQKYTKSGPIRACRRRRARECCCQLRDPVLSAGSSACGLRCCPWERGSSAGALSWRRPAGPSAVAGASTSWAGRRRDERDTDQQAARGRGRSAGGPRAAACGTGSAGRAAFRRAAGGDGLRGCGPAGRLFRGSPPRASSRSCTRDNIIDHPWTLAPIGIIAIGEVLLLICGEMDLSVGFILRHSPPFLMHYLIDFYGVPPVLAVLLCLLMGLAVGFVNGFFTVTLGVPSFITTLGTGFILQGIMLVTSHAVPGDHPAQRRRGRASGWAPDLGGDHLDGRPRRDLPGRAQPGPGGACTRSRSAATSSAPARPASACAGSSTGTS